jgi:12-oxophytodienoic acid reductase
VLLSEERPISSTDKPVEKNEENYFMDFSTPRPLTVEEIPGVINHFRIAAQNAMEAGKFTQLKLKDMKGKHIICS